MSYHRQEAERLADKSLDGDYGSEEYRLRLAAVAQVYATLALVDQLSALTGAIEVSGGVRGE